MSTLQPVPENPAPASLPGDIVSIQNQYYVVAKSRDLLLLPIGSHRHRLVGYHHTDTTGMLGILEANTLWASSPMTMNDSREVHHGQCVVSGVWEAMAVRDSAHADHIDNVLRDLPEVLLTSTYVLSVSGEPDLLNQWQGYSGVQGFALGLDLASALNPVIRSRTGQAYVPPITFPGWYKVLYEPSEQEAACRELLSFLGTPAFWQIKGEQPQTELARFLLATLVMRMKHKAFRDEREYRYITSGGGGLGENNITWWRSVPRGPIPYARLVDQDAQNSGVDLRGTLPLVQIMSGPGSEEGNIPVVRRLLQSTGYERVLQVKSAVPYRP